MAPSRIAVCSWSLRPNGPEDVADGLSRVGIPAAQLALRPLIDDPERWSGAVELLRSRGVTIVSGMLAMAGEDYSTLESIARTGGLRPDETWPADLSLATRVSRLAAESGIPLVSFHAGFIPEVDGGARQVIIDRLHLVVDAFEHHGVGLALETGQETARTLAGLLRELRRPEAVGVNFDPANMILYGMGDPVAALEELAPHVRQIHVKDANPTDVPGTWGTEVPAGTGSVDWAAFFRIARALDPPVDFVIEREAGQDRTDDIVAARRLIEQHLAGTGS